MMTTSTLRGRRLAPVSADDTSLVTIRLHHPAAASFPLHLHARAATQLLAHLRLMGLLVAVLAARTLFTSDSSATWASLQVLALVGGFVAIVVTARRRRV